MPKKNEPEWPIIDWTAFEQQQANASEVPEWALERAEWYRRATETFHSAFARYIAAHEPKGEVPKLLTEAGLRKILKEEGGVAGRQQDRIVRGFKARALLAPEPEPVDPLVAALASIDIGLSDIELQKLKDMGVAVTAPARGEEA